MDVATALKICDDLLDFCETRTGRPSDEIPLSLAEGDAEHGDDLVARVQAIQDWVGMNGHVTEHQGRTLSQLDAWMQETRRQFCRRVDTHAP